MPALDPATRLAYGGPVDRSWLRIAHRGASGAAPELTRAAFARALEIGVDMIELDVQLTRDEQLVVLHDATLERTTDGRGAVAAHTLAELKQLDAGSWFAPAFAGERVLSLQDVFDLVGTRARLNVEIKAPAAEWAVLVPNLLATLARYQAIESTVVSCFEPDALGAVRGCSDRARLGVLWSHAQFDEAWRWAAEVHAVALHPLWLLASAEVTGAAHARGLDVLVWTVNDPAAMRALLVHGVDGIMSDFPERFAALPEPRL